MCVKIFSIILFAAGNTTNRYYGPVDRPFVQIGRGILRTALYAIVSDACNVPATPQEIQKAIREGLNTIRLHDRDVKERASRRLQLRGGVDECEASEPEFIDTLEGQGEDAREANSSD